jgi:hypothetical protein
VSEPKPKPFDISKRAVWDAWLRVKANKGAAGVDEQSITEFEGDLKGNLYKLWNRLSSGSYFPPPVRMVQIPKRDGSPRVLGVPTVADRIAQTVVRGCLEPEVEPVFHGDSYGYRPGRSALDAVGVCRERCWQKDWVLDLDLKSFFDSVPHDLVLRAVAAHTDERWVLLYVERWLKAPLHAALEMAGDASTIPGQELEDALGSHLRSTADRISARLGYRHDDENHEERSAARCPHSHELRKSRTSSCLSSFRQLYWLSFDGIWLYLSLTPIAREGALPLEKHPRRG